MINRYLLVLLSMVVLGSCRTLQVSDFNSPVAMPDRLPRLGMLVHEPSFLRAFDDAYLQFRVTDDDFWYAYQVTDQATDDVFRLFQRDLAQNILSPGGDTYGHMRFKLLHYNRPWKGAGWIVPSVATLFIANYLGMPFSKRWVELELQVEVTDANNKVLVQYIAAGKGKTTQALYYGYDAADAIRRSNLIALKDAMTKIKDAMIADVAMLRAGLEAAGPIPKASK